MSTSASSIARHIVLSTPQSRSTCSTVSRSPGISMNSARSRPITVSCVLTMLFFVFCVVAVHSTGAPTLFAARAIPRPNDRFGVLIEHDVRDRRDFRLMPSSVPVRADADVRTPRGPPSLRVLHRCLGAAPSPSKTKLPNATEFPCAVPILKRPARRAREVVPLLRVTVTDAAHMTVLVVERAVTG